MPFDSTVVINSPTSNFSLGPTAGNLYYFDIDAGGGYITQRLIELEGDGGSPAGTPAFTYNIISPSAPLVQRVRTLSWDGSFFWTLEAMSANLGMTLRRWQIVNNLLEEQESIDYQNDLEYKYESEAVVIEHYLRPLVFEYLGGTSTFDIGDNSNIINNRTFVTIGPSTHANNVGETEFIKVSSKVSSDSINLTRPITFDYSASDPVKFYTHAWFFNYHQSLSPDYLGSLIVKDLYNKNTPLNADSGQFANVTASTFYNGKVYYLKQNNLLKLNPTTMLNETSMSIGNVEDDMTTVTPVVDIDVDSTNLYKMQTKYTSRDGGGDLYTTDWGINNLHKVVLVPYYYSIGHTNIPATVPADLSTTIDVTAKLRDQYFNTVPFTDLNFSVSDAGGGNVFPTTSGTDTSGEASTVYTAGDSQTLGSVNTIVIAGDLKSSFIYRQDAGTNQTHIVRQTLGTDVDFYLNQKVGRSSMNLVIQRAAWEDAGHVKTFGIEFDSEVMVSQFKKDNSGKVRQIAGTLQEDHLVRMMAGDSTGTTVTEFIFVVSMYPQPFAIKIPLSATFIIRVQDYNLPLLPSTLYFEVEGVDVTSQVSTDYDAGTLTMIYDPAVNFSYGQRVNVVFTIQDQESNEFGQTYYFDCVPDYRKPYVDNVVPANLATDINADTSISFDVFDVGEGVDISTLVLIVDGTTVIPSISTIADGYHVSYTLNTPFPNNQKINVSVEVEDVSAQQNKLLFIWSFTTAGSVAPSFTAFDPAKCEFSISNLTDVELDVYGLNDGIEGSSIKMKINESNVEFTLTPKIYRIL